MAALSGEALAGFRHPSEAAHKAGCRCTPCVDMRYRSRKRYRLQVQASGSLRLVPAVRARRHVERLVRSGFQLALIARAAGVSRPTVEEILTGERVSTGVRTEAQILGVSAAGMFAACPPESVVPNVGARRRIQALLALGWPAKSILPERASLPRNVLQKHDRSMMTAEAHRAIAAAYDRLSMEPGPSLWSRRRAARAGYPPPLAWDDETIDDPAAVPDLGAPDLDRSTVVVETVEDLLAVDVPPDLIAGRLSMLHSSLLTTLHRAGRDDLAELCKLPNHHLRRTG